MQPIADFNEVTMHALETIYTHLFNTKGPLPGKGAVGGGAAIAQPMHVSDEGTVRSKRTRGGGSWVGCFFVAVFARGCFAKTWERGGRKA